MGEESCAQAGPARGCCQDVGKGRGLSWELWCPPMSSGLEMDFEFPFPHSMEYERQRMGIAEGKLNIISFLFSYSQKQKKVCIYSVQHIY